MTKPFKYGANYGGENYNALSSGITSGAAAGHAMAETEKTRRQMAAEESNQNALNAQGMMNQPEYVQAMQDPSNRNQFFQDQGVTPAQQNAIMQNQRREQAEIVKSLIGPVNQLRGIYAEALKKNNNDPKAALQAVQPLYEQHVFPVLQQAGIKAPAMYDDRAAQMFTSQKQTSELMTTPQYYSGNGVDKPGVYFPTKEGKRGAFVRDPLPGDLKKDKGDEEKQWQDKNRKLIDSYSEDNPDIPKKVIETMIPRAIENKGGLESEKSLDSEMTLLLNQYRIKGKSYLPTQRMDWPKFKGKGQGAPASKRYGNKLTILD